MIALSTEFTTDLVTAATLTKIRRTVNEQTGRYVVVYVNPSKFRKSAYSEYPGVVRPRSKKYARWKMKQVGHDIPNVLTGALKAAVTAIGPYARITATSNGGRVILRAPWSGAATAKKGGGFVKRGMRESQRQELEAVSDKQRDGMARRQAKVFEREISDPKNRRKRAVRKAK